MNNQLTFFEPIGLEEVNQKAALLKRVDTKYVLRPEQLPALLPLWSQSHRVLEIEDNRLAHYKTIYYDTANFSLYHAHHSGTANRVKFRERFYENSGINFFEIKVRTNKGITDKIRSRIKNHKNTDFYLEEGKKMYPRHLNGNELKKSLQVNYDRITLVGNHHAERITIDCNLQFSINDQNIKLYDRIIIEVKTEKGTHSQTHHQLKKNGIRSGSISKYCLGIIKLYPEVKKNRFKNSLRIIEKQLKQYDTTTNSC